MTMNKQYEAANTVTINCFGYEHNLSAGGTETFLAEEVQEMHEAKLVCILLGDDGDIEHVIQYFGLNAHCSEAGEYLVFVDEEFDDEVYDEMVDCGVGYDLARR
jgi:cephalosporin hydroxylase